MASAWEPQEQERVRRPRGRRARHRAEPERDATPPGWQPLSEPRRRLGAAAFSVSPFGRLARTHAATSAGDALILLALAGSLFFDIDPEAARWRIALGLLLTMTPFAVVAPLIGPALDRARGGRRLIIVAAAALRVVVVLLMFSNLDNLLLFPLAFSFLVLQKAHSVARSAIVPTVVRSDAELVRANSRLSVLSTVAGFAIVGPGFLARLIAGGQGVLILAAIVFAVGTAFAVRIPPTRIAREPTTEEEREELRGAGIRLAASAMGLLRGFVGFLTFLVAFDLRSSGAGIEQFGVAVVANGIGWFVGAAMTPALRRSGMAEERIMQAMLSGAVATGLVATYAGGLAAMAIMAFAVGMAAGGGKQAFDSIVQRDAPDANRGRSFARFETRFQLIWVVGSFVPVVIPIPARVGYVIIAAFAGFALFSYTAGTRALRAGRLPPARRAPAWRHHLPKPPAFVLRLQSLVSRLGLWQETEPPPRPADPPVDGPEPRLNRTHDLPPPPPPPPPPP
jgi:MFS family permease